MIYLKRKIQINTLLVASLVVFMLHTYIGIAQSNQEQYRPQFHFTPPAHWMNDPNGMVYYKGEYHLFYQYYPDSTVWGPMHWGHAVSKDLVHWQYLPIALYPDTLGYIFSGSAVVDVNNTSGFGKKGGESPLVAIYTSHSMDNERAKRLDVERQSIAYSLDKGRTWTKYAQNPVLKNSVHRDFRDPKVSWNATIKRWVMILAVGDHVEFYNSKNLKDWSLGGEFGLNSGAHGGVWECPDLFQIDVGRWTMEQGKTKNKIQHPKSNVQSPIKKWILISNIGSGTPNGGSGTQYFVGDFDGKKFINDNVPEKTLWLDSGKDDYAGITWSNAPDGRRIFIGWMSDWQYANKVPTVTWRSATTVPRELSLQTTKEGLRLFQKPVEELKVLRLPDVGRWTLDAGKTITTENYELNSVNGSATELDLSFDLSKTKSENFGIILSNSKNENIEIGYNVSDKQFYIDRSNAGKIDFSKEFAGKHIAPRISTHSILKMHLLIDVASVELFADDGNVVMTDIFFPNENFTTTKIFSRKGTTQLLKGRAWRLKSIWK